MSLNGSDSLFAGWQVYPENIPLAGKQQFAYDLQDYNERLADDSRRLFVPNDKETLVQVVENGVQRTHSHASLQACL